MYEMLERNKIICADVREGLKLLPDNSVQCVITSPPYWGLRDYGTERQVGLESTPDEYVQAMVGIFREVRRVLRPDGTVWLNLGDSYAGGGRAGKNPELLKNHLMFGKPKSEYDKSMMTGPSPIPSGLKPKDLVGIPWRVAFALQADGWWLRMDIIWAKPNPMPESVTDRPTKSHEYIFLLTKRQKYFYDAEAVREPLAESTLADKRNSTGRHTQGKEYSKYYDDASPEKAKPDMPSWYRAKSFVNPASGRNRRSVWTVATQSFPGAHFATFSPRLITPMILAGSSPKACEKCGAPWKRVVERKPAVSKECPKTQAAHEARGGTGKPIGTVGKSGGGRIEGYSMTTGWRPTCPCQNEGKARCIILDPFIGSGTTAMVAAEHGRDWIGIELNPEYVRMAKKRIKEATAQQRLFTGAT